MPPENQSARGAYVAVFCAMAVAVLPRVWFVNRGLGQDELFTAVHFVETGSIAQTLFSNIAFNNHIFYSLMARISELLFGRSEWALRLPAVILGIATVYVVFLFARDVMGAAAGVLAAVLMACSPAHIVWSSEARGYSGLIFFTLLATYLYFRALRSPTVGRSYGFVLASVLGIYVHVYAALTTAVQLAILACARWIPGLMGQERVTTEASRPLRRAFVAISALACALYVPVILAMSRDVVARGRSTVDPTLPWAVLRELSGTDAVPVVTTLAALALIGGYACWRAKPLLCVYAAALLLAPLTLLSLARPFDLYPRFFAYWLPYYLTFVAAGLLSLWGAGGTQSPARPVLRVMAIGCAAVVLMHWAGGWSARVPNEGYRETSAAIDGDDPSIGFCAIGGARSVWQYYLRHPIAMPASIDELHELSRRYRQLRCAYYRASWQSEEQTAIAEYLKRHAVWGQVNGDLFWFRYAAG